MIARGDIKEKGVIHAGKIGWYPQLAKPFFFELKREISTSMKQHLIHLKLSE